MKISLLTSQSSVREGSLGILGKTCIGQRVSGHKDMHFTAMSNDKKWDTEAGFGLGTVLLRCDSNLAKPFEST